MYQSRFGSSLLPRDLTNHSCYKESSTKKDHICINDANLIGGMIDD